MSNLGHIGLWHAKARELKSEVKRYYWFKFGGTRTLTIPGFLSKKAAKQAHRPKLIAVTPQWNGYARFKAGYWPINLKRGPMDLLSV